MNPVVYIICALLVIIIYFGLFESYLCFLWIDLGKQKWIRINSEDLNIQINELQYNLKRTDSEWTVNGSVVKTWKSFKIGEYKAVIIDNAKTVTYKKMATSLLAFVIVFPLFFNIFVGVIKASDETIDGGFGIITAHADENAGEESEVKGHSSHRATGNANGILSVESKDVNVVACNADSVTLAVSRNVVWTDNKKHSYNAEELVNQTICAFFEGENGEKCYFIGQYNEAYHWEGPCTICAYLDGNLYYVTDDVYENGSIISYKRFSRSNSQWIYTDKTIDKNGNSFGDTWSYEYKNIPEKEHASELPTKDDLYSVSDVRDSVKELLISHYYGAYNSNQDWYDLSGEAYVLKYQDSKITEVYKGTVADCRYVEGTCIQISDAGDYIVTTGTFSSLLGGTEGCVSNSQTYKEVCDLIKGKEFEAEITNAGWYKE